MAEDVSPNLYEKNLDFMIKTLKSHGSEVIILTPNMMNNTVFDGYRSVPALNDAAEFFVKVQNDGTLDSYVDISREVAEKNGVPVCDVYAKWKVLDACGVHTELLLANHLNHPSRDVHKVTALCLLETMMTN